MSQASSSEPATLAELLFHVRDISAARLDFLSVSPADRRETWSAGDFLRAVHSLALALEQDGLQAGDRVAIFSANRPECHIVDFACHLLGAPTVPIFSRSTEHQLAFILRNSGARWVFYGDASQGERLRSLAGALTQFPRPVAFDADAVPASGSTLTRMMGKGSRAMGDVPLERLRGRAGPEDLAGIVYTSGTTGDPKGVMLSHRNLVSNFLACARAFPLGPDDLAISFLPLSHLFQRTVDHLCFYRGTRIHYVPDVGRDVETLSGVLARQRPTVLAADPETFQGFRAHILQRVEGLGAAPRRLFHWALRRRLDWLSQTESGSPRGRLWARPAEVLLRQAREAFGGKLRFAVSGGAPLDPQTGRFYDAVGIPVFQGYGLTETSPVVATNHPGGRRPGSVGRPISEVEIRISQEGEILVRGPGVMQGYWQDSEATDAAISESGWFHTGDLGSMDQSGYVFVTDRKQDVLTLIDGNTVLPRPIEALWNDERVARAVAQAVVVGDGRPFPAVLLVPRPGAADADLEQSIEEHMERVNLQLPTELRLRRWALLEEPLTLEDGLLTASGRPRRKVIHRRFAELISSLYRDDPD